VIGQLRSVGVHESDLGQGTAFYPLVEDRLRPRTVHAVAAVELFDEDGEDAPALRRVDDDRSGGRQVGDDAVLEVERESRLGAQVGQPVAGLGSRDPT
jgi:hypothetical protein